jgi:hypothetical protein
VSLPQSPQARRVFIIEPATATLLAAELVANDPGHFGVRVPAGTTILSTTWLEAGWADKLGRRPWASGDTQHSAGGDDSRASPLEMEPSLQPTLVAFSSRADADDGVVADLSGSLVDSAGVISYHSHGRRRSSPRADRSRSMVSAAPTGS